MNRRASSPDGTGTSSVFPNSSIFLIYLASFGNFRLRVPSLARREKVDGAMVALHLCDHRDGRMRAGGRPRPTVLEHHLIFGTPAFSSSIWLRLVISVCYVPSLARREKVDSAMAALHLATIVTAG
jgi:hypothetical protein